MSSHPMSEVIQLPPAPEVIWVCGCGCSTFDLMGDGTARCAVCSRQTPYEQGGWHAPEAASTWNGDEPVRTVRGNNGTEFARRRVTQLSAAEDAIAIIVIREDGTLHTWSSIETSDQRSWLKRQMVRAYRLCAGSPDA
jgi:hypothetical protein